MADFPGAADVTVTYAPFQLDPDAPVQPVPHLEAYAAKLGDPERARAMVGQLESAAAGEGLPLRLDQAQRVNTFDAHRLLDLALGTGGTAVQQRLVELLMQAYFVEGRNIADHGELAALAKESGLTGVDVTAHLASDSGVAELSARLDEGSALGLDSVPSYVFERRWAVSGAQSPEIMGQVLQQIEAAMLGGGGGCCGGGEGGCACSR